MIALPNLLTLARILILPVLVGLLYCPQIWAVWAAFFLYILAAITDFFDGYIARKMNLVSDFGTFLDPIADKIFVACLLIVFVDLQYLTGFWIIPAILILVREFFVSGLREYLGPKNEKLPVSVLAKWKTTIQMVALGVLLVVPVIPTALLIGQVTLALAAFLTVITGFDYAKMSAKYFTGNC